MLVVQETSPNVFDEIPSGSSIANDGVLHSWQITELWTDTDLAAIHIFKVQHATVPQGKQPTGAYTFARDSSGVIQQVLTLEDIPAPPLQPPVIPTVSPRQIRLALNQIGLRQAVEDYVNAAPIDVQDSWHYSTQFVETDPMIAAAMTALGKTQDDLKALFALAASMGIQPPTPPVERMG